MKKIIFLLILVSIFAIGIFAETADYFTFTIGSGGGYDLVGAAVVAHTVFGVDYAFNETFSGGFKFFDIAAVTGQAVNISVFPADKMRLSVYTGDLGGNIALGLGFAYDIFSKKDALFANMSVNLDWFASDGGAYDLASGGVILFGLRTQVGL